jgi:hypothetical protein
VTQFIINDAIWIGLRDYQQQQDTVPMYPIAAQNYTITPQGTANRYSIVWEVTDWYDKEGWCTLNSATGTFLTNPAYKWEGTFQERFEHPLKVKYTASVYDGNVRPMFFNRQELIFEAYPSLNMNSVQDQYHFTPEADMVDSRIYCSKTVLCFGETATITIRPAMCAGAIQPASRRITGKFCYPTYDVMWWMPNQKHISFGGIKTRAGTARQAVNDEHSVQIVAGSVATTDPVGVNITWADYDDPTDKKQNRSQTISFTVLNDLVPITKYKVEGPAVGNPMSTPQLYLMSNCGNQVYRNSVSEPGRLINAMVSATLSNSFSPGYPILASGDLVQRFPTSALANLSFWLVDGNFHPIKLLNPMYLTINVNPLEQDANSDISQWNALLPLTHPHLSRELRQKRLNKLSRLNSKLRRT